MSSNCLWFGLMPPGGTGNIFHEMAVRRNTRRSFVQPCELAVGGSEKHKWPYTKSREPYVIDLETQHKTGLRSIAWNEHSLTTLLKKYNKDIWLGTFDPTAVPYVKDILGDKCLTISIGYDSNDYQFVLSKWARWQTGLIMENKQYQSYREKFQSSYELENYLLCVGSREFGYEIPQSRSVVADVIIPLRDLFNRSRFSTILSNLDVQPTDSDWKFYEEYCLASGS